MGEIAALATSFLWSTTSLQFTLAGRRIGSGAVNRVRLVMGVAWLVLAHGVFTGQLWPQGADLQRWLWLGLSGIIGLVLGDACLFQAFVLIGPRRAMLLMTLVPVLSTVIAWVWLGERLQAAELLAIVITVAGVAWVVSEPRNGAVATFAADGDRRLFMVGVLLGLGGALGQSLGLVFSKQGLAGDFPALSATLMRMVVAAAAIWAIALVQGRVAQTRRALDDRRAVLFVLGGSFTGPFLGVWMSLIAVQNAPVGIASTLMALAPLLLIPMSRLIFREQISPRAVAGTLLALVGVALIFLL